MPVNYAYNPHEHRSIAAAAIADETGSLLDRDPCRESLGGWPTREPHLTQDTPPGLDVPHQPCRHFPLRAQDLPKSNRLSSNLSLQSPPPSCLPYPTTHCPAGSPGSTCARENENPPACPCPYPAGRSEPVLPLATPIAALVTSARESAPKHSARPLAHDNILRPLDHPSGSPRCLLSTALRRRSFSSLLQLRGPMRRPHKG